MSVEILKKVREIVEAHKMAPSIDEAEYRMALEEIPLQPMYFAAEMLAWIVPGRSISLLADGFFEQPSDYVELLMKIQNRTDQRFQLEQIESTPVDDVSVDQTTTSFALNGTAHTITHDYQSETCSATFLNYLKQLFEQTYGDSQFGTWFDVDGTYHAMQMDISTKQALDAVGAFKARGEFVA